MGRCAALVNSIPGDGFGGKFNPREQRLSDNPGWRDFLRTELRMEERIQVLEAARMMDARRLERIRTVLEHAADGQPRPVLNHGDLRLKNVLVDDEGRIRAILDWENCSSNLAPQWEFSLALHDLSIDNKQEFIRGYGLSPAGVLELAPVMQALNAINYAPHVRHAVERNDTSRLEWYRLRFRGALDLYPV
jgi:aminoglycoside phosphotransferase (APT) family kinase protein